MRTAFLLTVLIFCLFAVATANEIVPSVSIKAPYQQTFKPVNRNSGIPQSYVLDIEQDNYGFLWFATYSGLIRYDGYETKLYDENHGLSSDKIHSILIDKNNTLWVGSIEGLMRYDMLRDTFETIPISQSSEDKIYIHTLYEDRSGRILVSTKQKLFVYDPIANALLPFNKNVQFPNDIWTLFDEPSRLWIGSLTEGAFIYDKRTKELFSLKNTNPWSLNVDVNALYDIDVIDGTYWLGTNKGLLKLNERNAASHLLLDDTAIKSIHTQNNTVLLTSQDSVIELVKQPRAEAIGAQLGSEFRVAAINSMNEEPMSAVFTDKHGSHWVGTENGVRVKSIFSSQFPIINKDIQKLSAKSQSENTQDDQMQYEPSVVHNWGIAEDSHGNIWSVTQGSEISLFQRDTYSFTNFKIDKNIDYWDIAIDEYDRLWVASDQGVRVFGYENGELSLIDTYFADTPVYNLYCDDQSVWVWISGTELVTISTTENTANTELQVSSDLVEPRVVFIDDLDRIWVSSSTGAFIFDGDKKISTSKDFKSLERLVIAVYDYDGFYWVATHETGILKFDKRYINLTETHEPDPKKQEIFAAVGLGNSIWYAHEKYIIQYNLDTNRASTTITPSQLYGNSLYEGVGLATKDGLLAFGGKYGYHLIAPSLLQTNNDLTKRTTPPLLTKLTIDAEEVEAGANNSPLTQPIHLTSSIGLSDDMRLSFTYALVNSIAPLRVDYRYRLTGFDKDWLQNKQNIDRTAVYHNIPWDNYILEIQAKEPGKQWSDSVRLSIEIARPPWFSNPALFFYSFVACLIALLLLRQWKHRQQIQRKIKASEETLKLTLWSSGDELWDWDIYRGQVYRANTWGTLDFPQDDIRTNSAYDGNIHPNDFSRVQKCLRDHLSGKTEHYEISYRAKTFKNKWVWLLDRGKVVKRDHNNQAIRMTGTLKNIQHLKEAEEQLRLFERSIENISEGVFITDTAFRFISVNQAYCKFTGETREQALATYLHFHQYSAAFTEEIKKALRQKGNWSGEVESRRVDGERYEMEINIDAVHDDDHKVSHYVGVFSDITARKSTEKELLKLSNIDPLTELPNRSFFQASQQNLVRRNELHALLCLDMDNFKKINDSLGHQTGDVLIKQIAKRLQRITGNAATCYRLGGDEFGVLMEDNPDVHMITHFAQNILDSLSRPFIINKQEFVLGASIGITFFPNDGTSHQELLKNADTAMYFAKNSGGNTYKFFSGEMNQNAVRQLQIENLIRQGLKDDLFTVYYQPKIDISSGKLVSMEALVRFEHPQKGIVSPSQFIPLAEQTGQIIEIGEVVLEKALKDTKRWVDAGLFKGRVAVNISAKQFELPDLDDRILTILKRIGLSSLHLECEITEGTLMENPEQGLMMMQRLRERGIHLALDDFGTGYSSLAYLKKFPINTLKIDKAFIDDIAHSSVDRHMTAAIINIAHNLGLNVVAEGVEHEEQLLILRRYDCEMLQGYVYSKPLDTERFEKLLRENQDLHQFLSKPSFLDQ